MNQIDEFFENEEFLIEDKQDSSLKIFETEIENNQNQNFDENFHSTKESYNVTCELLEKKRRRKKKRKKRKSLINEENLIDLMLRKEKLLKL
jgi:hypothetical protein